APARAPDAAERDVLPPLSGGRDALHCTHDLPARDDEPEVVADRRHELLDDRAGGAEPRSVAEVAKARLEARPVGAQPDVFAPASERRLDDERGLEIERRGASVSDAPRR